MRWWNRYRRGTGINAWLWAQMTRDPVERFTEIIAYAHPTWPHDECEWAAYKYVMARWAGCDNARLP